jgi:O-6-methylguanine DNA methyltransferase
MKLAGKSKAALFTTGLTAKEYIRRAIATHRDGVADVRRMLKESPDPATAAMAETASRNQIDFWAACFQIPEGYVASYATLSRVVQGARGEQTEVAKLSRVAGNCMAQNPLIPLIPCHRVVGVKGGLTGYLHGLDKKAALLTAEGVPVEGRAERFTVRAQTRRLL